LASQAFNLQMPNGNVVSFPASLGTQAFNAAADASGSLQPLTNYGVFLGLHLAGTPPANIEEVYPAILISGPWLNYTNPGSSNGAPAPYTQTVSGALAGI